MAALLVLGRSVARPPSGAQGREDEGPEDEGRGATNCVERVHGRECRRAAGVIEVVGIDHVQLPMPAGGEAEARRFYGQILGLREVDKPPALAGRGGCWFAGPPGVAIHLAPEES